MEICYGTIEARERADLIDNLAANFGHPTGEIQERLVGHLTKCDRELGQRVAERLGLAVLETAAVPAD